MQECVVSGHGFTGCGKTRFCGLCNKGTASAGPQIQQKMMGFNPCGMHIGDFNPITRLFPQRAHRHRRADSAGYFGRNCRAKASLNLYAACPIHSAVLRNGWETTHLYGAQPKATGPNLGCTSARAAAPCNGPTAGVFLHFSRNRPIMRHGDCAADRIGRASRRASGSSGEDGAD